MKNNTTKQTTIEIRMNQARTLLEDGLQHIAFSTDALANYLRFRSRFHTYSHQNSVLLLTQRPTAQLCMGYRAWQQHGRQVRKGEKGLMVFAPILRKPTAKEIEQGAEKDRRIVRGFRIAYTFDYEQTEAVCDTALMYQSPIPQLGTNQFETLMHDLEIVATQWGYRLVDTDGYAEGYCNWKERVIGIRQALAADDRAAVLAHELAHAAAHGPATNTKTSSFTHAERELQAEGAAFMALYSLGLDTSKASLPYLKNYAEDDEMLFGQLKAIEEIAIRLTQCVLQQRNEAKVLS